MTTKVYQDQEIEGFHDYGTSRFFSRSGRVISDKEFHNCLFESCVIHNKNIKRRTTIQNLTLENCSISSLSVDGPIIRDTLVDGLKTYDLFQTFGTVFQRVTLKGKIGRVMFAPYLAIDEKQIPKKRAFDEANSAFYAAIDWALDISQAEFFECDIRAIPAKLIRRDPETQVVVTREKALAGEWKKIDLAGTYWPTSIEYMIKRGYADDTLVAPKAHPRFRALLDGLRKLRAAGVAEPD